MTNVKDSALPAATSVGSADTLVVVQGATSKQVSKLNLLANSNLTGAIGVNQSSPLAPIHVGASSTNNSVDCQILVSRSMTGAGNSHGFSDSSTFNKDAGTAFNSFDAVPNIIGTANLDHYAAFQTAPFVIKTGGVLSRIYGLYTTVIQTSGTTTNVYGSYVADASGAGTIVNQYGLYVAQLTKATTDNYAVYTNGTTPSYFGGNVLVGGLINCTTSITAGTTMNAAKFKHATGGTYIIGIDATSMACLDASDAMTNFRAKGLSTSTSLSESIPTNGIYALGNIQTAGEVLGSASTTARASLNIPHGSAPTSPVNGDIWTTTAGLYVRINGATIGPLT